MAGKGPAPAASALCRWPAALLASHLLLSPLAAPPAGARATNALYASTGIGFINIDERGPGVRAPLGLTAALNSARLIVRLNALDLNFVEGDDRDPRYVRYSLDNSVCVDSQTGFRVASYRCSGGTDLQVSSSFDFGYIALDEVWISEQRGALFVGGGLRLAGPRSAYGTVGFFFERAGHSSGGVQLLVGQGFVGFGLLWGYDLRRLF